MKLCRDSHDPGHHLNCVAAIIIFGGAVLRDFALAMLWGVTIAPILNFCCGWCNSRLTSSAVMMKTIQPWLNMNAMSALTVVEKWDLSDELNDV